MSIARASVLLTVVLAGMFLMGCNGGSSVLPVTPEAPGYDVTRPDTEPSAGPSPPLPVVPEDDTSGVVVPVAPLSPEPPVAGGSEPPVGPGNNNGNGNDNLDDEGHSPELGTMTLLALSGLGAGASRLRRKKRQ